MKKQKNKSSLNVIDFFCGCGGLSLGFLKAGYKILLGVDNDTHALTTYQKNIPGSKALNIDLSRNDAIENIRNVVGEKRVDVIIGGPPCQGFSLTGPRNFKDERNKLYVAMWKAVKEFSPAAFVIENVTGMITLYDGKVKDRIISSFEQLGYKVNVQKLNSADYGVPQVRKRVFFVGLKKGLGEFSFPGKLHTPETYITCEQAIGDLPSREIDLGAEKDIYSSSPLTPYQKMMRRGCSVLNNHVATCHSDIVKKVISMVPEGENYKSLPKGVGEHRRFHEAWTRYSSREPSRTIDTGHRNHFHYKYNRVPTVRENARFQSFPDSFIFYGNKTQQYRQVGDAVPPLLGYSVANKLSSYLRNA
jgi:DNA (cytosine-5)-methyltransferase 1